MRFKMKSYIPITSFIILALSLGLAGTSHSAAGIGKDYMTAWRTVRTSGSLPGRPRTGSFERIGIAVMLNLVKTQYTAAGKTWIYNLDSKRFWLIDNRKRTYAEGSFKELAAYHKRLAEDEKARLRAAKEEMSHMTEEGKKRRLADIDQRMLWLNPKTKAMVRPFKAEPVNVAGFDAEPVGVYIENVLVEKLWTTGAFEVPSGWRKFLKLISAMDPVNWKAESLVDDMPVKGETHYGGVVRTWDTQSMAPGPVSIDEFRIPINFTKVEIDKIQ